LKSIRVILWSVLWITLAIGTGLAGYRGMGGSAAMWRPDSSGAVGTVQVFGQTPDGPVPLAPGGRVDLRRPQHLAFALRGAGPGPRDVLISLQHGAARQPVYDGRWEGGVEETYLDFVLRLDERTPDEVQLWTQVDAPHAAPIRARYRIRLKGASQEVGEQLPHME
jgi:hypothetical protein